MPPAYVNEPIPRTLESCESSGTGVTSTLTDSAAGRSGVGERQDAISKAVRLISVFLTQLTDYS